jgi:orotidine-5'-phosphate decarboxylase
VAIVSRASVTPIVALDVASEREALALVDRLGASCRFYKIGSELFTAAGPRVVETVRGRGCDVFLDLKFHDIPNTVAGAVRSAGALGASLLTVHASGGVGMIQAAVDAAGERGTKILAVTILTSFSTAEIAGVWGRDAVPGTPFDVPGEVIRLAGVAVKGGAHGIVCSGHEAAPVRKAHGDRLELLVPGVRLPGGSTQDQARVVSPRQAAEWGATYIILGRAVTGAADPVAAMAAVARDLAGSAPM